MTPDATDSTDQRQWLQVANKLRDRMAKRVADSDALAPVDLERLISACRQALQFHAAACCFDATIDRNLNQWSGGD